MKTILIKLLLWLTEYKKDPELNQSAQQHYRILAALNYAEGCISRNGYKVIFIIGHRCNRPKIQVSNVNGDVIIEEETDYEHLSRAMYRVIETFVAMKVRTADELDKIEKLGLK